MVWGAVLGAFTLFLFLAGASASLRRSGKYRRLPPYITHPKYVNYLGLGTWNVRGINWTAKREEVVNVFRKRKVELLALTETKLKENEDVSWYGLNDVIACIQEMERAREGVDILLKDAWHSAVVDIFVR